MDSDGEIIRQSLAAHGQTTWGWVICRCSYADEDAWKAFLDILNTNTKRSLEFDANGDLWDLVDWVIIEDREGLEGAGPEQVRRRFGEWVEQSRLRPGLTTRSKYCLSVDAESLASIKAGPQPPARDIRGKTWVNVVNLNWDRARHVRRDRDENRLFGSGDDDDDGGGDRLAQIVTETRPESDVGWMRVGVGSLAPRVYAVLDRMSWEDVYERPPRIVRP